jgi:hypothetical protein
VETKLALWQQTKSLSLAYEICEELSAAISARKMEEKLEEVEVIRVGH